jgi:hypothetical protein
MPGFDIRSAKFFQFTATGGEQINSINPKETCLPLIFLTRITLE